MLFWLSAFLLDRDHTSSQEKTNFRILFLSSIQPFVWHFSMTCSKKVLQMNSVFNSAHFSQALKDVLSHRTGYLP